MLDYGGGAEAEVAVGMVICVVHTELRVYWPARLAALKRFAEERGARVQVIEICGKGSAYGCAGGQVGVGLEWWRCVFPEERMERLGAARAARGVARALEAAGPDVVLAGGIAYPSGAAAVRWANARGRGVVIMDDARVADVPRGRVTNWVKRRIYGNVDGVLLPAVSHAPDYEFWGVCRERMFFGVDVVDNGFFVERAEEARRKAADVREKRGLPRRFLLGVGRQIERKNWGGLVQAWREFKRSRPKSELRLVLVGDGPERPRLMAAAGELPKGDVVFRGFLSQEELAEYYGLAAGAVLPSLGETWGLVVNEAMACGLPVLVSRQCGCAQTLVEPGRNGWCFDARSHESILEALVGFEDGSEEKLGEYGERSRAVIMEWGLERFCEGAWGAIWCALKRPKGKAGVVDRAIMGLWSGRYRPG